MNVLLVIPPVSFDVRREMKHAKLIMHLGMAYIAASLRSRGFDVEVCDIPAERLSLQEFARRLRSLSPRMVGITSFTAQIFQAHAVAGIAKEVDPGIVTVIGGAHASALPEGTLRQFPAFDLAVYGEGEETVCEIASRIADGKDDFGNVDGAAWRKRGEIRKNAPRRLIRDLDSLAFPAFDLYPLQKYTAGNSLFGQSRIFPIMSGRGCPYECSFCFRLHGSSVRTRSVENVIQEMRRDIDFFNTRQFFFQDETFTLDRARTLRFCDRFLAQGLIHKADWICETRVDAVDRDLLKKMKQAGCSLINYGIESGSQDILDRSRKRITLEQIHQAVAYTKEADIRTFTNFIIGNPYDTPGTIEQTIKLAFALNSDFASFTILTPFPGTETLEMARRGEGNLRLLSEDWRDYSNQFGNALELENIPLKMLERFQRSAYFRFYMRPSHIFRAFKLVNGKAALVYAAAYYLKRFICVVKLCVKYFYACLRREKM